MLHPFHNPFIRGLRLSIEIRRFEKKHHISAVWDGELLHTDQPGILYMQARFLFGFPNGSLDKRLPRFDVASWQSVTFPVIFEPVLQKDPIPVLDKNQYGQFHTLGP